MLQLRNVVIQYDLWIVAKEDDDVATLALGVICGGEKPNEIVAYVIQNARDVPSRLHDTLPFVSETITDEEYAPFTGSSVPEVFEKLKAAKV